MKSNNRFEFKNLEQVEDSNLDAILIYGENLYTKKKRLLVWYHKQKGLEEFYDLHKVLRKDQCKRIKRIIKKFDSEAEVFL